MKRLNLENAAPAVQQFIRTLPATSDGFELAFGDRVIWKLVPPAQLSESQKSALLAEGKELLRRTRERNEGVPARVIEKEIRDATAMVRGKRA